MSIRLCRFWRTPADSILLSLAHFCRFAPADSILPTLTHFYRFAPADSILPTLTHFCRFASVDFGTLLPIRSCRFWHTPTDSLLPILAYFYRFAPADFGTPADYILPTLAQSYRFASADFGTRLPIPGHQDTRQIPSVPVSFRLFPNTRDESGMDISRLTVRPNRFYTDWILNSDIRIFFYTKYG